MEEYKKIIIDMVTKATSVELIELVYRFCRKVLH